MTVDQQLQEVREELSAMRRMLELVLPSTVPVLRGMNNKQLAKHYDVDPATIYRWRQRGWLDENNALIPKNERR